MLKRYFLSNILFVLFANLLIKPIWMFGVDRNVQLLLGHDVYGSYTAVLGLCVVFAIMLDMGVTNYNNLMVAGDKHRIHESLPNMLLVKIILSILYVIVLSILAWVLQYSWDLIKLLWLVCCAQILASLVVYLRSNISANHDFKTDALLSIVDKVIMIITCALWLLGYFNRATFTIHLFVGLQVVAYVLTMFLCFLFIRKNYARISWKHLSVEHTLSLFRKSFPYAALIFFMGIYMRGDAVLLERLAGSKETGLFANAFRILDVSNTLGVLTAGVLLPMFSRLIAQQDKINQLVQVSTRLLIPASMAISIFCAIHAQSIMMLIYKDASPYTATIFAAMMVSFPAYSIQYVYSTLLTAKQSLPLLIRLALVGCVLSLILNLLFIFWWKAEGAAITSVIVQWLLAAASVYYAAKHFKLEQRITQFLKYLSYAVLLCVMNWFLNKQGFNLWNLSIVNLIMVPILYIGSGFMRFAYLRSYLRKNFELP
ncbi:MAG: polysaccharide biosynthesis C-terminal domain-containing protein [Chitinophagaceae bacterium]|nr:polysaccharide biosynthesis C-terminal domain-containing protein [Chitinophagaceae bacterium]